MSQDIRPPDPAAEGPMQSAEAREEPAPDDAALLHRVAREVVRRHLVTPAILFLESAKPLNFVASQLLVFLDPILRLFLTLPDYGRLARLLERRESIEWLIVAIERAEEEES